MDAIASAATQDAEVSQSLDEDAASASKRAKMTNDRIQLVANTLMEEGNMRQYGLILKSTAQGHSAKGSKEQLSKFAQFLNAKNHPVLQGCHLGVDALQNWIKQMRNYATTEAARRNSVAEKGRGDGYEVPQHIDACFQLMEYFKEFDDQLQKNYANRYLARPSGMEGVELVKDSGATIRTGDEIQGEALLAVRERRNETKRRLMDDGVSEEQANKAASRATSRPRRCGRNFIITSLSCFVCLPAAELWFSLRLSFVMKRLITPARPRGAPPAASARERSRARRAHLLRCDWRAPASAHCDLARHARSRRLPWRGAPPATRR